MNAGEDLAIAAGATIVLQQAWGAAVAVGEPELLRAGNRSRVVRCPVHGGPVASVIVKQATAEPERSMTDRVCLSFLSADPSTAGIAPRFYGGDATGELFVMEDLGDGGTLDDLLAGDGPAPVRAALDGLARTAARLHSATLGREADFARVWEQSPGRPAADRHTEAAAWLAAGAKVLAWFDAFGCVVPEGFDAGMEYVAHAYAQPGPFLALTHGDFAPTNNHVGAGGVRLLDFEYGGYRHALYDMTAWEVLCPLLEAWLRPMVATYRRNMVDAVPVVDDDRLFEAAWATLCVYRTLAMLTWTPPAIIRENRTWVGEWTAREAILTAVSRSRNHAAHVPELATVCEGLARLQEQMTARWPEHVNALPRWPAAS